MISATYVLAIRFVVKYYDDMKPYFALDPLLRPVFMSLTPDQDFPDLCERVSPCLTSALLNQNVLHTRRLPEDKVYNTAMSAISVCKLNPLPIH